MRAWADLGYWIVASNLGLVRIVMWCLDLERGVGFRKIFGPGVALTRPVPHQEIFTVVALFPASSFLVDGNDVV
jgi:hypothetical protein